ncbi:MAG: hypothetical protein QM813_27525 [Verrucomicrobiota bacterium]
MSDRRYPLEMTDDEAALGFRHYVLDSLGERPTGTRGADVPDRVVAKILSPSDVLVKMISGGGGIVYSHLRWGWVAGVDEIQDRHWYPVHVPLPEAEHLIGMIERRELPEIHDDIVAFPFDYRAA